MSKLQSLAAIATLIGAIFTAIALVPAFGQWLAPRAPTLDPGVPAASQVSTVVSGCVVPQVEGLNQNAAETAITKLSLGLLKSAEYSSSTPEGIVISQSPPKGTKINPCQGEITIVVSLGIAPTQIPPTPVPAFKVERFCNTGGQSNHPTAEVEVPLGYKIVGGGAKVNWTGAGAFLTASYPESIQKWVATGKDHDEPDSSSITVCALALFDPEDMWDVRIFDKSGESANYPFAQVTVPTDYTMVGGGARVNWTGKGNLLTASFPNSLGSWEARSKDHLYPSPATITVSAIGIKAKSGNKYQRFPETTMFCRDGLVDQHISSNRAVDAGYVLLGGGAIVHWSAPGNMLTASYPDSGSSWAAEGKDHVKPSLGYLSVCAIGFKPFSP